MSGLHICEVSLKNAASTKKYKNAAWICRKKVFTIVRFKVKPMFYPLSQNFDMQIFPNSKKCMSAQLTTF